MTNPTLRKTLARLVRAGAELEVFGERLQVTGCRPVSSDVLAALAAQKADVLACLRDDALRAAWPALPATIPLARGYRLVLTWLAMERDALSPEARELNEERSAIMEFDGRLPRWLAELSAIEAIVSTAVTVSDNTSQAA